jgi:hypothetical protein
MRRAEECYGQIKKAWLFFEEEDSGYLLPKHNYAQIITLIRPKKA